MRHVMKTQTIAAIILIAIGIVAFAYQGITYTTKEKVIDIGPIEMTADSTENFSAAADRWSCGTCGRHCIADRGKEKGLTGVIRFNHQEIVMTMTDKRKAYEEKLDA